VRSSGASERKIRRPKKKPSYRSVKIYRSYTIDEASTLLHRSKETIRRWLKSGELPALTEQRPHLILGRELADFLKANAPKRKTLKLDEWYCLRCKEPRKAALGLADFVPKTPLAGRLTSLCEVCAAVMHKAVAMSKLAEFQRVLEITLPEGRVNLKEQSAPHCSDNIRKVDADG
jgi:hypothetical protein